MQEHAARHAQHHLEREERRAERRQYRHRGGGSRVFLAGILVFAMFASVFAIVTVATWGSVQGTAYFESIPATPSNSSTWVLSVSTADLRIGFTTNASAPEISINVAYDFSGAFLKDKTAADYYSTTFDNASAVKTFTMQQSNTWNFAMIQNTTVFATLKAGVSYNLTASTSTGNIALTVPANQSFSALDVAATTGNIGVTLGNGTVISGGLSVSATTGNVDLAASTDEIAGPVDIQATTGSVTAEFGATNLTQGIEVSTTTGPATVSLNQAILGGNVVASATTGSIGMTITNITLSTAIRISGTASTGSITAGITQGFNPGYNITVDMSVTSGDVNLNVVTGATFASTKFTLQSTTGVTGLFINNGGYVSPPAGTRNNIVQTVNQTNPFRIDGTISTTTGHINMYMQNT